MSKKYLFFVLAILLLGIGVIARLVDHPANFAPIGALAIVTAFYYRSKIGILVPLGAMFISDLFIGFYDPLVMLSVYASYVAIWLLGRWASSSQSKFSLAPATLLGSSVHFLLTNFAVWAFTVLYAKSLIGLYTCYVMAIPFFKWTLFSDLLYTGIFVGIIETARYVVSRPAVQGTFLQSQK